MNLQDTFYIVAIIYMIVGIIILLGIFFVLWNLLRKIQELKESTVDRVKDFIEDRKNDLIGRAGFGVAGFIFKKIKNIFRKE